MGHKNSNRMGRIALSIAIYPLNRNMASHQFDVSVLVPDGVVGVLPFCQPALPAILHDQNCLSLMIHCFSCRFQPVSQSASLLHRSMSLRVFQSLKQSQSYSLSHCLASHTGTLCVILRIFVSLPHRPSQQICTIQTARFPSHTRPSKPLSLKSGITGCCLTLALSL